MKSEDLFFSLLFTSAFFNPGISILYLFLSRNAQHYYSFKSKYITFLCSLLVPYFLFYCIARIQFCVYWFIFDFRHFTCMCNKQVYY